MNMPGFTGQASIYTPSGHYRGGTEAGPPLDPAAIAAAAAAPSHCPDGCIPDPFGKCASGCVHFCNEFGLWLLRCCEHPCAPPPPSSEPCCKKVCCKASCE